MICEVSENQWGQQLEALGALLRAQRLAADLSLRALSERARVSNAYLSELERGLHEPSLGVLTAITAALGMPLSLLLSRAGVIERSPESAGERPSDTESAIRTDPALSEPQRLALLSVYRSFIVTNPPQRAARHIDQ